MSNLPPPDDAHARGAPDSVKGSVTATPQQKLHGMLAGIWERSKKTITERIETLREAQSLAAQNNLDEPARLRAVDAAHKLAGVLGTFGLPRGTELAREAEETFGSTESLSQPIVERLGSLLAELDNLVKTAGPSIRGDGLE